eukprot:gene40707-49637_t
MLSNIPVTILRNPQSDEALEVKTTLREACAGKIGVIDLWHTKCTRCPAALSHLNDFAASQDPNNVMLIACALSLGAGNQDAVVDFISEWGNLYHFFIEESDKESLKAQLGYSAVPFYVVFDENGNIKVSGDSKAVDYQAEVTGMSQQANAENHPTTATAQGLVFDEDF